MGLPRAEKRMGLPGAKKRNTNGLVSLSLLIYFLSVVTFFVSHFMSASLKAEGAAGEAVHASEERSLGQQAVAEVEGKTAVLHEFIATAYCLRGPTWSGIEAQEGVIAADPAVLPIGSVVRLRAGRYSGLYTVLDTGARVRGRMIDIWIRDIDEALSFGVRKVKLQIVRRGWKPAPSEGFPPD